MGRTCTRAFTVKAVQCIQARGGAGLRRRVEGRVRMMRTIGPVCTVLVWVLGGSVSIAAVTSAEFSGSVVRVLDGDTLEVRHAGVTARIRLQGIDCPEKRQAFGQRAKQAASGLVFGQRVTITAHGRDRYGRTVGTVILPDGTPLNDELVRQGWCWWYRKYAPENAVLERLETEARTAKRGVWTDPHPIPPWEWRKQRK